ncbi:MAG: hypothetical protein SOR61_00610 [Evtepia sp.]|uniref:putative ABC transporter permease n=1 Tax=Evtepia sp. TaxID=2773933 RepID=UPI002A754326|nr:hypothetical protein [Evtepia sp.]MDY3013706.1 hypothetical protein [Evtepia sp.]
MPSYAVEQWLLLFYFYCFCGWLWESCYVSARQHQWVNRGFLHGPLLPIYGTGAISILFVTLPVRDSIPLIFLLGMLAATLLEWITGIIMEWLFHVRYWDYSTQPFNVGGYICLTSSLAWGAFSILLLRFLYPPAEFLLFRIPQFLLLPLAWGITVLFAVDMVQSFRAALDLRKLLTTLTEEHETIRRLAKRAEVLSAFAEDDLERFRARTQEERLLLAQRLEQAKAQHQQTKKQAQEELLRLRRAARLKASEAVAATLESLEARLEERASGSAVQSVQAELKEAIARLRTQQTEIKNRSFAPYRRALRILHGNPSAQAKRYRDALESLRTISKHRPFQKTKKQ